MKSLEAVRTPDYLFVFPDHVLTLALSTVPVAADLPSDTAVIRLTGETTASPPTSLHTYLNAYSTRAVVPTTGISSGSSAVSTLDQSDGTKLYRVTGSTGISALCRDSSGFVHVECWSY